jgi:parvulin-like peptidyl-prolyl isomerase
MFMVLLLVPAQLFAAPSAENVVASVGGVPITVFELQRQIEKILPLRSSFHGGVSAEKVNEIKQEALNDLIERAYKVKYALDNEISIPKSKVDEQIDGVRKRFKSKKEFKKAVGAEKISGLRAAIYRKLVAEKAEEVAVTSKARVGDEEIKSYYAEKKHMYFLPKQFRASHIMIKVDPASNKEEREVLKKKADEILVRAQQGEDFFDLAYYNSDDRTKYVGGDLGMFHEGQTEKPFEDALLKLKVGEISDLVKTRYGFHIIKLTQVNEPRQMTFDETRLKIKSKLEKTQRDKLYGEWLDSLKQNYKVERTVE